MTAEIGIMNRMGVALAADSAVTVGSSGRQKVFNSADKLFSLSKRHPVGIMVYGGADFMGVPWETIIKVYREGLGKDTFPKLSEYADNFFEFLTTDQRYVTEQSEEMLVLRNFYAHLNVLLERVNKVIYAVFKNAEPFEYQVAHILSAEVEYELHSLNRLKYLQGFSEDFISEFLGKHGSGIIQIINDQINFTVDDDTLHWMLQISALLFCKDIFQHNTTGVVIAGYGDDEIFPILHEYTVEGIVNGVLKYKLKQVTEVAAERSSEKVTAAILPFAQQEMVHSFTKGIDPALKNTIIETLHNVLKHYPGAIDHALMENGEGPLSDSSSEIIKQVSLDAFEAIQKHIEKIQMEVYARPIVDIVSILPKDELAAIAEALVNLTSFKRKVSIDAETVGGPIDVAIISKGDGFIWIKRKHYFKPELNYNFFQNYLRGDNHA
ncbi:hypothetical protein [Brevibacillus parabrevis]|uniref:hypothetical protein n=1 Tax=Brevibacillus parabrevis TaxID=54914 RepID=UPI00248FBF88|nr:hypothetical protein [Brevibacillus parabrevis]